MMNKIDAQSWKADMPDFRKKTKAFYNGEMSKGDYKGYSDMEAMLRKMGRQVCCVCVCRLVM